MATEITKVLHEFKLVGKAMAITTDNESAMLVCGRKLAEEFEREIDDLSFNHYRCSAHILNFAIKQGMEIIDNKEILDPEIDIETRWNFTYYMLCKLQQMETALKMLAIKHEGVREPTANTINALRNQFSFYITQKSKKPQLLTSLPKENTTSSQEYFCQLKKRHLGDQTSQVAEKTIQTPASSSTDFAEIERYLALPCDENVEALLWCVACEQAFSVAGNTIIKIRNWLHPETARALLCAKSWIDNSISENTGKK
ncbi:zinc finger BED domain-containing protein RICESLEEPER 2-like [Rhizophagus clarus]|uniref:Zinc finger BED domain-containing protein RICESLEEPER 2-like n=1 Tax=Rhizophagus clarus TaxID=94130 RepID=A0A8H3KUA4_9GLOM|nr:zinc finger BED domain-containing protein RICESLEEPER 2-like [Rhizophagus clarus]